MSSGQLLAYIVVALVMIVMPGPGVLFIVGRVLAHGQRTAVATAAGHAGGALAVGAVVAVGLGALLQRSAQLFEVMKVAGAVYLVWLGIRVFRNRHELASTAGVGAADAADVSARRCVLDGVVVGVTNPKSYILLGAVLPQFVNRSEADVPVQMMLLVLISVTMGLVSDCAWGVAAGAVRAWFARSPRRFSLVGGAGGLALIGLGLTVGLTGRQS